MSVAFCKNVLAPLCAGTTVVLGNSKQSWLKDHTARGEQPGAIRSKRRVLRDTDTGGSESEVAQVELEVKPGKRYRLLGWDSSRRPSLISR